ncbi:hypothetical protein [Pararhizobium sp. PWRC1-1]|uniref:hypothetical protein n=1 Tax=Pararhizobium sp. PWRC1-1 TaxID=2804566 RepID=UPI003CE9A10C
MSHGTGTEVRDGERVSLAGPLPAVSEPPPACGDPIKLGDVVALVVSDLGVRRIAAPVDPRREKEGRALRFAPQKSI